MDIIKRDGRIVEYNRDKIAIAISKANNDVTEPDRVNSKQIDTIIKHIEDLNKKRMLPITGSFSLLFVETNDVVDF